LRAVRLLIRGHVQGVGYRLFAVEAARRLGLTGYARNMPSRNEVEVVAVGSDEQIGRLTELLHMGPSGARVNSVEMNDLSSIPECDGFTIRY